MNERRRLIPPKRFRSRICDADRRSDLKPIDGHGSKGKPGASGSISRNFRAACERAGVKDLTFHDQRSEGASRMAGERGLDTVELAEQGGWRSLQVLRKYYRPDPRRIAARLDRSFTE